MTEQEQAFRAEAEEKQRRILAEESQAIGAVASGGEQVVEVRVADGGIVIRAGAPAAVKALGVVGTPETGGTVVIDELPCANTCVDAIDRHQTAFLHDLPFTEEQERVLQDVIAMYDLSRENALERLWERAVMRLITDEARRVIERAKSDG